MFYNSINEDQQCQIFWHLVYSYLQSDHSSEIGMQTSGEKLSFHIMQPATPTVTEKYLKQFPQWQSYNMCTYYNTFPMNNLGGCDD